MADPEKKVDSPDRVGIFDRKLKVEERQNSRKKRQRFNTESTEDTGVDGRQLTVESQKKREGLLSDLKVRPQAPQKENAPTEVGAHVSMLKMYQKNDRLSRKTFIEIVSTLDTSCYNLTRELGKSFGS
jgi:hypothetical protein